MYQGEVNIKQEDIASFLKVAETLQIKGLTNNKIEVIIIIFFCIPQHVCCNFPNLLQNNENLQNLSSNAAKQNIKVENLNGDLQISDKSSHELNLQVNNSQQQINILNDNNTQKIVGSSNNSKNNSNGHMTVATNNESNENLNRISTANGSLAYTPANPKYGENDEFGVDHWPTSAVDNHVDTAGTFVILFATSNPLIINYLFIYLQKYLRTTLQINSPWKHLTQRQNQRVEKIQRHCRTVHYN